MGILKRFDEHASLGAYPEFQSKAQIYSSHGSDKIWFTQWDTAIGSNCHEIVRNEWIVAYNATINTFRIKIIDTDYQN